MVKRYEMNCKGLPEFHDNGVWVEYEDFAALQQERDALAAEMSVIDAIHDKCVFITDDDYDACPKSVQEIIRSLAVMQIPATDAFLNSVRADAIVEAARMIAAQVWQEDEGAGMVAAVGVLEIIERQRRAAAPKGDSDAES